MFDNSFFKVVAIMFFFLASFGGVSAQTPEPTPTATPEASPPPTATPTPTPEAKEDDEIIKVDTALVNIPFSVRDRTGRGVTGLKAENFTLLENGVPQKIEHFSTEDAPVHLVLLLDTSPSARDIFDKIKYAASEFLRQLRPTDSCMVVSFSDTAHVRSEFTNDQKVLNRALARSVLSSQGGTVLRDTLFVTIDKELAKVTGRKAVILITDGKDAGSSTSTEKLYDRLMESDAPVYSVLYQRDKIPMPDVPPAKGKVTYKVDMKKFKKFEAEQLKKDADAAKFIEQVSEITAGRFYRKQTDNLGEIFNQIAEELRMQYLIGYYPDETDYDISKRQIKIRVDRANAVVRLKNYNLLRRDEEK